ncbi:MAG: ScyD/ScyE family protein [Marmoricola sp.]
MRLRSTLTTAAVAAVSGALALSATMTAPASARPAASQDGARKLDSTVIAPFQVAVRGGAVWWTDGFGGTITRLKDGRKQVLFRVPAEGLALSGKKVAYTTTPENSFSRLVVVRPGRKKQVVNLRRFERLRNPDGNVTYGIIRNYSQCAADFFNSQQPGTARYKGIKDSHPYQVEALPNGAWAIAEAAGNEILKVNKRGGISVLALLPRQPITFTQQMADALEAPDCVVGVRYAFEPVPTDVERDRRGNLWVSTLPGGPESPALGARGSVYRINKNGNVRKIKSGFLGATNLAIWKNKVYVAELFGSRISAIRNGRIVTARRIANPVAVEATKHKLFIGQLAPLGPTGPTGPGGIYRFPR